MKTPNTIEDEIDNIRLRIYEETKNMTVAQRVERTVKIGEVLARQYGFTIVASAKSQEINENKTNVLAQPPWDSPVIKK